MMSLSSSSSSSGSGSSSQKDGHKILFAKFCKENYFLNTGSTSKTVNMDKAKRIKEVLRGEKLEVHSPSFKFWVRKTKKFEVLSYPELDLKDVLCLPVKVKVSI